MQSKAKARHRQPYPEDRSLFSPIAFPFTHPINFRQIIIESVARKQNVFVFLCLLRVASDAGHRAHYPECCRAKRRLQVAVVFQIKVGGAVRQTCRRSYLDLPNGLGYRLQSRQGMIDRNEEQPCGALRTYRTACSVDLLRRVPETDNLTGSCDVNGRCQTVGPELEYIAVSNCDGS